jgi:3-phenylpropionate/cinnamic acid dioxygenase small subunit
MRVREIETFLYREARLMDEHRYQEWLSLWTDDAIYWVPCSHDAADPLREVSIIYDNRDKLADRAVYLESGTMLDADSKPLMRRVISNVEATRASEAETEVSSNFVLVEARGRHQYVWCGRSIHRLRKEGGNLKMSFKKVLLVNSQQAMPILQFLI